MSAYFKNGLLGDSKKNFAHEGRKQYETCKYSEDAMDISINKCVILVLPLFTAWMSQPTANLDRVWSQHSVVSQKKVVTCFSSLTRSIGTRFNAKSHLKQKN